MPLNILYVSKGLLNPVGGAQTASNDLLFYGLTELEDIDVYVLTDRPREFQNKKLKKDKIKNLFVITPKRLFPLKIPKIVESLLDWRKFRNAISILINKYKIDVVHIHGYSTFYIHPDDNWNVPIVYTLHDLPYTWSKKPINCFPFNFVERIWYKIINWHWSSVTQLAGSRKNRIWIHALSRELYKFLNKSKNISRTSLFYAPNGIYKNNLTFIDEKYLLSLNKIISNTRYKILFLGDFQNRKNLHSLIDAFKILLSKDYKVSLLIVGAPAPIIGSFYIRNMWKNISENVKNHIYLLGHVKDPVRLKTVYKSIDVVVLPSFSEVCSLIINESIAYNKIILCSQRGSALDLLPKSLTTIDPNSMYSIVYGIERLLKMNSMELEELQSHLKPTKDYLEWKSLALKFNDFYKEIKKNYTNLSV
ncbi:MAG: glycosyltransferase family 4 protein [Candidatus Hodarchaeota archaeon]